MGERKKREGDKERKFGGMRTFFANFLLDKTAFFLKHEKDTFYKQKH